MSFLNLQTICPTIYNLQPSSAPAIIDTIYNLQSTHSPTWTHCPEDTWQHQISTIDLARYQHCAVHAGEEAHELFHAFDQMYLTSSKQEVKL